MAGDAGARDEPGDVCHHVPDPNLHTYRRRFDQIEPDSVPARHRCAGGRAFTSGCAAFPGAREGHERASNRVGRQCLEDKR